MLPPTRRVTASAASAVRDRASAGLGYFKLSMYKSFKISIATYVASGAPIRFGVIGVCWANEAEKRQ